VRTADFDYDLPPECIAQRPVARGTSRLLVLDRSTGELDHRGFGELPELLAADDLLLLNDTRVIPARLFVTRTTGRRFELLLLDEGDDGRWLALLRPSARARVGEGLETSDGGSVLLEERLDEGQWRVRFEPPLQHGRLDRIGSTPLPPYIERPTGPMPSDAADYQTVYAAVAGAVAAPTAGLHFTQEILDGLVEAGVEMTFLTLHVGLGTFRPVAVDDIAEHRMHSEWYRISESCARAVNTALENGRRIVCVGTTSVRALEGALDAGGGQLIAGSAWTELFITPGYRFRGVGAMLSNFHLPRSTLLMLVSAFAGRRRILDAYQEAIREGYRFYSYGDAMLIL
jgi:S-adenosylmethionine:tRNA ribosyltransferase-isomerase